MLLKRPCGSLETYLSGGHSPDLEVVRSHEEVSDANTHVTKNPLVESLGFRVGNTGFQSGINQAINALNLVLLGKHGDVVLERVGNPLALAAHIGDTLVVVPVIGLGESLIEAVVEVLVVGEDDMATNVVELQPGSH